MPETATATATRAEAFGPSVSEEITRITPGTRQARLTDVFRTMHVAGVLAIRDFKGQYKQSIVGPLWLLLQPLGILVAFSVVFNGVTQTDTGDAPYALFALCGIAVWTFFSGAVAGSPRAFIKARTLLQVLKTPRAVFVTAQALSSLPQLVAPILLLLIAVLWTGWGFSLNALAIPLCILWIAVFSWMLMLLLATLNVWARDVSSILPLFMQAGVFITPIGYALSDAPPNLEKWLAFNPLTGIIEAWRWSLLDAAPDKTALIVAGSFTVVLAVVAWQVFKRLEPRFIDVL